VIVVRAGDNLDALARSHHIPGGWPTLYQTNRTQILHPQLIYPGQHLALP
jgi:nucleoid-associated protein YgaU